MVGGIEMRPRLKIPQKPLTDPEKITWDCDIGTGEDRLFRKMQYSKLDDSTAIEAAKTYNSIWHEQGVYAANTYLRRLSDRAEICALPKSLTENGIERLAKRVAKHYTHRLMPVTQDNLARDISLVVSRLACAGIWIEFPKYANPQSMRARLCDYVWWRRWFRKILGREIEAFQVKEGFVCAKKSPYISGYNLKNRAQQRSRMRSLMSALEVVNECGERLSLEDVAEHSLANPKNRRSEMMARISGSEIYANNIRYSALFITITCPSRMHATLSKSGWQNPAYDGTTPAEAQKYLCRVWAKSRASLKRKNIGYFGLRVAEPHQDGTPHWHLLVFVEDKYKKCLQEIIKKYALQDSPNEPGAERYRFQSKSIDSRKASATGYIAKYISKNIDGYGIESDLNGNKIDETCKRVDAWSSVWGIRQFQFFGLPKIGIWRELRKIKTELNNSCEKFRKAADKSNYSLFLELVFNSKNINKPELFKVWSDKEGQYGDPVGNIIIGIKYLNILIPTKIHNWRIELKNSKNKAKAIDHGESAMLNEVERPQPGATRAGVRRGEHCARGSVSMGFANLEFCQ